MHFKTGLLALSFWYNCSWRGNFSVALEREINIEFQITKNGMKRKLAITDWFVWNCMTWRWGEDRKKIIRQSLYCYFLDISALTQRREREKVLVSGFDGVSGDCRCLLSILQGKGIYSLIGTIVRGFISSLGVLASLRIKKCRFNKKSSKFP